LGLRRRGDTSKDIFTLGFALAFSDHCAKWSKIILIAAQKVYIADVVLIHFKVKDFP